MRSAQHRPTHDAHPDRYDAHAYCDGAYADHLLSPRGEGRVEACAYHGGAGGSACGDLVEIGLAVDRGVVTDAGFSAQACAATRAAASATVELVRGATLIDAARVGERDIDATLGGLRPELNHAPRLVADALHRAIGAVVVDPDASLIVPPSPIAESDRRNAVAGRLTTATAAAAVPPPHALVAMSGGVDSAVAALLTRESGAPAIGVTLQLWDDPANDGDESCCSPAAVAAARRLAHELGMPHITLDHRDGFRRGVVDPYVAAFDSGLTPSPCVGCNGHVRFDALDRLRERLGAARLVTGHYARVARDADGPLLRTSRHDAKDQTYMLSALRAELLERLDFPLGELTKSAVRERAREAGMPVADKPESQDLCFLAGVGRERFLARHGRTRAVREGRAGEIVDRRGGVLGRHGGAHRFTVGQRRGLGVAAAEPLYVLDVDMPRNVVVVGPREELATTNVALRGVRLLRPAAAVDRVKLRYRSPAVACRLDGDLPAGTHRQARLVPADPVDGAAPGQVACLMRGDTVVGWGVIARTAPARQTGASPAAPTPAPASAPLPEYAAVV